MNRIYLCHLLNYDVNTGIFTWRNPISTKYRVGDKAGSLRVDGYIQLKINGKMYLAHRLAWLYVHGDMPDCIDHINQDRNDNRLINLRAASKSQNGANRQKCKSNTTGYKGVTKKKGRFTSAISHHGNKIDLGYFDTPKKAHTAYCLAAYLYHGEFYCT